MMCTELVEDYSAELKVKHQLDIIPNSFDCVRVRVRVHLIMIITVSYDKI